jgi:hypothetical protein
VICEKNDGNISLRTVELQLEVKSIQIGLPYVEQQAGWHSGPWARRNSLAVVSRT